MKKLASTIVFIFMATLLIGCSSDSSATKENKFPEKDITLIVPKAPGGGTDLTARGLAEYAKKQIDQNIVVVNKPSGNGVTGMVEGSKAKKDGYTLTMTTVELAMLPHMNRSPVDYKDFSPIVAPIADPASIMVPADAPYNTLEEFLEHAKKNPGKLKVGNSGVGTIFHLASVAVEDKTGVKFTHVPYNEGSAPAVAALVGGHLDAVSVAPGIAKAQIDAGKIKVLAIMSDEKLPLFPEVPTFKELGYDITIRAWAALNAPADTPDEIMDSLNEIFSKTSKDPEFKKFLEKQGIQPVEIEGEELKNMIEEDHNYYGELLKDMKL
ncbi:tripartite tricarboxylate transporter substrate binding protein [Peribacillus glennii]|uniref:Tripartite tricarboxylate transporter substrate binding protein n=1 Tax=Peribacillus glennii TaxID=2303991 RepID=A0A372LD09_9BACI|nr:tripartite tricarboxylate transporter substrate binding protein [Peribacillus glennii]RFU63867.1 tripartite tricarboxylate transporter substrate binding protein [Peribacillus glennii]